MCTYLVRECIFSCQTCVFVCVHVCGETARQRLTGSEETTEIWWKRRAGVTSTCNQSLTSSLSTVYIITCWTQSSASPQHLSKETNRTTERETDTWEKKWGVTQDGEINLKKKNHLSHSTLSSIVLTLLLVRICSSFWPTATGVWPQPWPRIHLVVKIHIINVLYRAMKKTDEERVDPGTEFKYW